MKLGVMFFAAGYAMSMLDAHWLLVAIAAVFLVALGRTPREANTMKLPEGWRPIPDTIVQTLGPRRVQDGYDG